jgi:ribosomal protein L23
MKKISPYITEKSVELAKTGKFTLEVSFDTTKKEIESLVKKFYEVKPLSVNILKTKYLPSTKYRKKFLDRGVKKAIVSLEKGKIIPGFEFESKEETNKKNNVKASTSKSAEAQAKKSGKEKDGKKS